MPSDGSTTAITLDWDTQAVWVQERMMYLLEDNQDPDALMLKVTDQLGISHSISRKTLVETHVLVRHATVYKPRYNPVQAFCPSTDSVIETGDERHSVSSGDALVRSRDGVVCKVPRHEFNCRYQFVGAAADQPPFP